MDDMTERYSNIVVGVDGSAGAREALDAAADIAGAFGSTLHVVMATHKISPSEYRQALAKLPEEFWNAIDFHADANCILDEAITRLEERGIWAKPHLCVEHPAEALIGVAEREDADLIVVGSRGLGIAQRAFLGSVSSKMAHRAPCAVLITGSRQC
jgi:nucleotide-binding universal stress UspA family protein